MNEIHKSVLNGLTFTDAYLPDFTDQVLFSEDVDIVQISKSLHKSMRTSVPVPSIFTSLKIMGRLQSYAEAQAKEFQVDSTFHVPKPKNHVDHTVKLIFKRWLKQVDQYISQNSDWQEHEWNPWTDLSHVLKEVLDYNGKVFFGISLFQ